MNIEIANRLLQYRKSSGLSQEELAEKIGVSRQAVSKWERAEASPDTDNLIILAKVYGVSLDELLQGEGAPEVNRKEESEKVTPDENTTYVEDKRVSFKNGIHVHDGKDKVDISFKEGINVDAKDGSKVHVGMDGIHVHDGEKVRAYTDENGNVMVDEELEKKKHLHEKEKIAKRIPVWAISLILFFVWGYSGMLCGWSLSWISFLLIPIYYTFVDAVYKRNPTHFAYPVLCVVFQMITGFVFDGWTWGWIAYLTIPIYYCITAMFNKKDKKVGD